MNRTHWVGFLVAIIVASAGAKDAFARNRMYNPAVGQFMSRDPAGSPVARNLSGQQFTMRDPAAQYADGMNLYQYGKSDPVDALDPDGLWTRDGVLMYLCRTNQGRAMVISLNRWGKLWMSEFVRSQKRSRGKETDPWGPWQPEDWGGMTVGGKDVHVPKRLSDEQAALTITHETIHVKGGGEELAYEAETWLAIRTPGLSPPWPEFVKTVNGERVADEDAIKKKVAEWYQGWYEPSPLVEYQKDAAGNIMINYGHEDGVEDFACKCPKEFYYYDYGYPPKSDGTAFASRAP